MAGLLGEPVPIEEAGSAGRDLEQPGWPAGPKADYVGGVLVGADWVGTRLVHMVVSARQPMMRRASTSMTNAT